MSKSLFNTIKRSLSFGSVQVHYKDGIVEVNLQSQRKNALSLPMMHNISNLLDTLHQKNDELYGLILSGDNDTFCSGFDLKSVSNDSGDIASQMCTIMHSNFLKFASLPLITVAAIEGYALGGGAELTAWCDHRIMSKTATVRFVQAKMGVSPGWAGGIALSSIVGKSKALQILNGTIKMNGLDAKELGFVEKVVEAGLSKMESRVLLKSYLDAANGSMNAIKGIKKALIADPDLLRAALARERESFLALWGGQDNKKAISNSLKKN